MPTPDTLLAAILRSQHGACTVAQAKAAGFSVEQIKQRVIAGRWIRAMRGVLVEASSPATWERAATVALLSRPDGAAALLTAARIIGIVGTAPTKPTLLVPRGTSTASPVARLIRRHHDDSDIEVVGGMRTTTPARTLVDLAPTTGPKRMKTLVDTAMHRRITTPSAVDVAIARAASLPIASREVLLAALEVWRDAIRPGSAAEARLIRLLAEWGFDEPDRQIEIADSDGTVIARIDTGWRSRRLGLEYDSTEWHGRHRWASDEARHAAIAALGWELLHVEAPDLRPGSDLRRRLDVAWRRTAPP